MKTTCMARIAIVSVALIASFIVGCGKTKNAKNEKNEKETAARRQQVGDLKQIGLMYRNYLSANKNEAPANADDFIKFAGNNAQLVQVMQKLKSGEYVLTWGMTTEELRKYGSSIVGYEKDAPTSGGIVLMGFGSARYMTAAEFQSTPKASSK